MAEADYLSAALFDRTPAQRRVHGEHTLELNAAHPGVSAEHISRIADRRMKDEFFAEFNRLAMVGIEAPDEDTEDTASVKDFEEKRSIALAKVCADIAVMHEVLPMPMLDRLPRAVDIDDAALQEELAGNL